MYKILIHQQDHSACSYYRAMMPYLQCRDEMRKRSIRLDLANYFPDGYDCYVFQRRLDPRHLPNILRYKDQGKKIVWDLDDHLFEIPQWSPAHNMMGHGAAETLSICLNLADRISVTTDRFRRTFGEPTGWLDKISVTPNLVNLDDWDYPKKEGSGPVKILWAGSDTHAKDLESIGDDLVEIVDRYKSHVHIYFVGAMPPQLLPSPREPERVKRFRGLVTLLGPVDLIYYSDLIDLIGADVALMPLVDCAFNRCKSPIKYLEMTMGRAASVASPVGPYADAIDDGVTGLVSTDFYKSISTLIENPSLRFSLRDAADEAVRSRHSWQSRRGDWLDFYESLAG